MSNIFGDGEFTYKVVENWGEIPEGWSFTQVAGVAVDSQDRVYVFNRGDHPIIIFECDGKFLKSWGEGRFETPHGIYIDSDDYVYLADSGNHTVRKFTTEGKLLMTLGTEGNSGENGAPFNKPTDVALSVDGEIFVSDGYGNSRVHKYSPDGKLLLSWGEEGDRIGQFNLPHGIFLDRQKKVYVADRQNHRIQVFTTEGEFITQWTGFRQPCTLFIDKDNNVYVPELQHRVSILNLSGEIQTRWGDEPSHENGKFVAPHTACTDSHGSLYIGEVLEGKRIQKFVKISKASSGSKSIKMAPQD